MSRGAYRAIHTVLVDGPDYQALTPHARLVLLTLKLNLGPTGIDVLYPAVLEAQTGLSAGQVATALGALEGAQWIRRDRNVVWIVDGLKYEPSRSLTNGNHRKEIAEHLAALPRLPIVVEFRRQYGFEDGTATPQPPAVASHTNGMGHGISDGIGNGMVNGMGDAMPKHGEREKGKNGGTEEQKEPPSAADAANTDEGGATNGAHAPEPPAFAAAMDAYPKRAGDNPRRRALRAFRARLKAGERTATLVAGAERYRAWCDATGKTGTEFVMQAATFFGPDRRYLEAWEVPEGDDGYTAADRALEARVAQMQAEQASQLERDTAWLASRAAYDVPAGVPR